MNIPATKALLQREILGIISKMKVVVPQIPDEKFKKEQAETLEFIQTEYEKLKADHDKLKSLLLKSKSNVFNVQLKYPSLKQVYDQASEKSTENLDSKAKELFSEETTYELRKQQAELRMKRLQALEINQNIDDDAYSDINTKKKEQFIGNLSL